MRIAAIDLGSNSFHLLAVDADTDGTFVPLLRDKEILRLGAAVGRFGRLPPEAMEMAVATMRRFRVLTERAGAERTVACATSAIREAANGADLVARIKAETGIVVEVLTGDQEAELVFDAVRASVVIDASTLCFDLGGGSLEVMVGGPGGLAQTVSVELGAAKLSAELVEHDPPSVDDVRRLRRRLTDVLAPVAESVAHLHPTMAVGSSGTLCDLARMAIRRRTGTVPMSVNNLRVGRDELLKVHDEIMAATAVERLRLPGIDNARAELMPAGAMVLVTAMELFGFSQLTVSEWALREGIVLDVIRRSMRVEGSGDPRYMRRASVMSLARRCNWDEAHGRQVARLATDLFDLTLPLHGLDGDDRELLANAALLHDIGHHVSSESHHKHTAYLIQHGRLRGFDPDEVAALAALARYHRRGDPKASHEPYASLSPDRQRRVTMLAGVLRIADGLDYGHTGRVGTVEVEADDDIVTISVTGSGPLEVEMGGARRKRHLFEKAFGRRVEVTTRVRTSVPLASR